MVKGAEPLFTAGLSAATGSAMPWPIYLTLLPVIAGVGMASVGELSFSVLSLAAAMTANASAASRSVLGKKFMSREREVSPCGVVGTARVVTINRITTTCEMPRLLPLVPSRSA